MKKIKKLTPSDVEKIAHDKLHEMVLNAATIDATAIEGTDLILELSNGVRHNAGQVVFHGRDGIDGSDGRDGRDGIDGIRGPQGERGEQGFRGALGPQGIMGPQGERGEIGPIGPQGARGPMPRHEFKTMQDGRLQLRFELPDGTFGDWQILNDRAAIFGGGSTGVPKSYINSHVLGYTVTNEPESGDILEFNGENLTWVAESTETKSWAASLLVGNTSVGGGTNNPTLSAGDLLEGTDAGIAITGDTSPYGSATDVLNVTGLVKMDRTETATSVIRPVSHSSTLTVNVGTDATQDTDYHHFDTVTTSNASDDVGAGFNVGIYDNEATAKYTGSGTASRAVSYYGHIVNLNDGTLKEGLSLQTWQANSGTGTLEIARGILAKNALNDGGGTIDLQEGIKIEAMTSATENFSIRSLGGKGTHLGDWRVGTEDAVGSERFTLLGDGNVNGVWTVGNTFIRNSTLSENTSYIENTGSEDGFMGFNFNCANSRATPYRFSNAGATLLDFLSNSNLTTIRSYSSAGLSLQANSGSVYIGTPTGANIYFTENLAEKMRLDDGVLLIGRTTPLGTETLSVNGAIRCDEVITNTSSLLLGVDTMTVSTDTENLQLVDINDEKRVIPSAIWSDAVDGTGPLLLPSYGAEATDDINLLEETTSTSFDWDLTTPGDVLTTYFILKPAASGDATITTVDDSGKTMISEFTFTIDPGDVGVEKVIELPNPITVRTGNTTTTTYAGPAVYGTATLVPAFFPYLRVTYKPITDLPVSAQDATFTEGVIPFADSAGLLTSDSTELSWDAVKEQLLVGTDSTTGFQKAKIVSSTSDSNDTAALSLLSTNSGSGVPIALNATGANTYARTVEDTGTDNTHHYNVFLVDDTVNNAQYNATYENFILLNGSADLTNSGVTGGLCGIFNRIRSNNTGTVSKLVGNAYEFGTANSGFVTDAIVESVLPYADGGDITNFTFADLLNDTGTAAVTNHYLLRFENSSDWLSGTSIPVVVESTTRYLYTYDNATPTGAYSASFVDGDLTAGEITFTHNLGQRALLWTVMDNNGESISPSNITFDDSNNTTLDLTGFTPITGTWTIVLSVGDPTGAIDSGKRRITVIDETDHPYTVIGTDETIVYNSVNNNITINIPAAEDIYDSVSGKSRMLVIKNKAGNGTSVITAVPNGSQTLDGDTNIDLVAGEGVTIESDGTSDLIIT